VHRLATPAPPLALEKGLYLASEGTLFARLQAIEDAVSTVLMITHNDGIWHLATALAGRGRANLLAALNDKFPTGALATLRAPVDHWRDLASGDAELVDFVRPRDLVGA